jgi:hypothetical protein
MAERERVKKAIEAPVDEAAKLLEGTQSGDVETRLAMLIDGWGRGLAAGLEELAIAIGDLRRSPAPEEPNAPPPSQRAPQQGAEHARDEKREPHTEEELKAAAARSREETAELREEATN